MMNSWYEIVPPDSPLTQGDMIFNCPVPTWQNADFDLIIEDENEVLKSLTKVVLADVVVMTQACDLQHGKVRNVTLCPHHALSNYKTIWKEESQKAGQNPTEKAWKKTCESLSAGYVWNQHLLNTMELPEFGSEHRLVDFYEVYTVPKVFLEGLLRKRGEVRPRLLPPYREHLSQAFARFYMRVGLPTEIKQAW